MSVCSDREHPAKHEAELGGIATDEPAVATASYGEDVFAALYVRCPLPHAIARTAWIMVFWQCSINLTPSEVQIRSDGSRLIMDLCKAFTPAVAGLGTESTCMHLDSFLLLR